MEDRHLKFHGLRDNLLDPDDDIACGNRVVADERMDPAHALDAVWHPRHAQDPAGLIDDAHVVVRLGPVDPDEDHLASFLLDNWR